MSLGKTCGELLEKTLCLHLSLSLLNESPKGQSSRLKVVEDLQLSFDSYRNLVSPSKRLPTTSSVTVKDITFFQPIVVRDSRLIATETSCPRETVCGQLLEKTVCFHLSLCLLNETPKGESS